MIFQRETVLFFAAAVQVPFARGSAAGVSLWPDAVHMYLLRRKPSSAKSAVYLHVRTNL